MFKSQKLLTIFLLVPILGYSQLMVGPKLGVNIASQFNSDFSVPKTGFMYGAAVDIQFGAGISIQGEFLVTQKGWREEYKGKEIFDELTATYLEIPAMAKYTFSRVNWGYYAAAGIYWSYWSKGKYKSSTDGNNTVNEDYIFTGSFDLDGFKDNRSDFGAVAEIGVTYDNLGTGVLALGLRYSHGFVATNSYQTPSVDVVYNYNRVLTLSLTYFMYFN